MAGGGIALSPTAYDCTKVIDARRRSRKILTDRYQPLAFECMNASSPALKILSRTSKHSL